MAEEFDSVTRLTRQPLTFFDLPNEILGEIVGKLDLVNRLQTRKVSRRLQAVVDQQNAHCLKISFNIMPKYIDIVFDRHPIRYNDNYGRCLMEYNCSGMRYKQKVLNGHFLEIAITDLEIAIKKPKHQLEELRLYFHKNLLAKEKILSLLKSLKSPIHVKSFRIGAVRSEDALSILSLAKPGILEEIDFGYLSTELNVNQLVEMDQWKRAKKVDISNSAPFGIEHCIHLDRFDVFVKSLSAQEVLLLRDVLSNSTNFNYCYLHLVIPLNIDEIGRALGATVVQRGFYRTIPHRYPIPMSIEFLEINIDSHAVIIKKKT